LLPSSGFVGLKGGEEGKPTTSVEVVLTKEWSVVRHFVEISIDEPGWFGLVEVR
jgi:hypothetical protein